MTTLKLPQPKISDVYAITITSPDLDKSVKFYEQFGFKELFRTGFPFPLVQLTDGAILIMLRKDVNLYMALSFYAKDPDKTAADLENAGVVFLSKPKKTDFVKRYLFQSPDGLNISIVTYVDTFKKPKGHTMLTMKQADYFNPEKYANKTCGMFGELAHPVKDLKKSIIWWKKLGFEALSEFESPYPWAIVSDGLVSVGLHQTKQFSHPAITYFASDMDEKIEMLKKNGLKDFKTVMPSNITVKTPEGQHINLFKLGM